VWPLKACKSLKLKQGLGGKQRGGEFELSSSPFPLPFLPSEHG